MIGYSADGGIFVGRGVRSEAHSHYSYAIVLAFGPPFVLTDGGGNATEAEAALIRPGVSYGLAADAADPTAFFHVDPYSGAGLALAADGPAVRTFPRSAFAGVLASLGAWLGDSDRSEGPVARLIAEAADAIVAASGVRRTIDARLLRAVHDARDADPALLTLRWCADRAGLSPSRFSHLFREQTGAPFKRFVLHRKLVRSLAAVHGRESLTEAAFFGGFADQSHFTKAFKGSFGIAPSRAEP